ncbi:hypothetical protein [Streptomyces purpureus]|uniref:Uncharacterized protein n=1 Tax=Streptomyces purpureus TaxID=1951 RepID=A0A918H784_9ACTN|nr:hypothetical protein [Streptomyces purpureus]GGT43110.1 hypothetical protein GCM10014713_41140 [Streptomyces purpureus]
MHSDENNETVEPAEHMRFARYIDALAQVPPARETALIADVLADPDRAMAESAVTRHLDRRATELLADPEFPVWTASMGDTVARFPFLTRRLAEWSLFRAVSATGGHWEPGALIAATDWLQRKVSEHSASPQALRTLAEHGRTRRVRNAARARLNG